MGRRGGITASAMTLTILLCLYLINFSYCDVDLSNSARKFSVELLHHTQLQTNGHVVISPFGIWTLLSAIALGAGGRSQKELQYALRLPSNQNEVVDGFKKLTNSVLSPTSGVSLSSHNFMFFDTGFQINPNFKNIMKTDYQAVTKVLDFKDSETAAKNANSQILSAGGGRVSNVLTSDDFKESKMILANVISFKGLWSSPFNESDTAVEPFYDENGNVIGKVKMMYQRTQLPLSNLKDLNAFVIELPYGTDNKYSMVIILPHYNAKVADVYKKLGNITLIDIFNRLQADIEEYGYEDVDLRIPRFKISTNVVLNKPLNDMQVYEIFDRRDANFERITKEKIFVSSIVHKADIEVTESGTVASAATTAFFADRISPPNFHAKKPFIYFIVEKSTTTIIFSGIYSIPSIF